MKNLNYKTILLLLVTISSICLGNIQINIYIRNTDPTYMTKEEPSPSAAFGEVAWIVICGDRSDHDKLDVIRSGCDQAYEALINRQFTAADIYYLDPSYATAGNPQSIYRDADTTRANIQWAIETWAPARGVSATTGLGIYMFDHGGTGYMCIPGTDITDTNLNTYLDNLEAATGCNRVVIIYEACHAGSFINPVSKDNRIVLTATDITHGSYVNPSWDWATFSEGFFSSIIQCKTIGESFEDAEAFVHAVGDGGIQFPWIDDDHNDVGHEVDAWGNLPHMGDGSDALNYWIGSGLNCPLIFILWLPLRAYIKWPILTLPITAVVQSDETIKKVEARLIPPDYVPPPIETDDEGSIIGVHYLPLIELQDQGDGNYSGAFTQRQHGNFLGSMGDYEINIIAKGQSGAMADVESIYVTLNEDGQTPPDNTPPSIAILTPSANETVSEIVEIVAEGDDDQGLNKIQLLLDGALLKEEPMPPNYPYPQLIYNLTTTDYIDGLHNLTAISVDNANNIKQTSIVIDIQNGLEIPGFPINTLFLGSLFGLIIIYAIYIQKNRNRRNK